MNKIYKVIIYGLFLFMLAMSCAHKPPDFQPPQPKMYTAYNMWHEKPNNMYCVNYQRGTLLPAGTEVEEIQVFSRQPESEMGRPFLPNITFKSVITGQKYRVKYKQKYHPKKNVKDYSELMFTLKTFEELTKGMSDIEIDAIKRGVIVSGMSKKAVIASAGVPPDHRTPYLESNIWVYWTSRFENKKVCFNSENVTTDCSE